MDFTPQTIAALVVATSFAAGLNVYATILTLGILARFHWVALPGSLTAVENPWVLGAAGVLFLAEFVADKIPGFDLIWNAAHTFIRIPVAALMAYGASQSLSPGMHALVTLMAAGVAMAAHGSKLAARGLVTPSPEPVSNIALSSAEDVGAIGLTWVAMHHPYVAAGAVAVALLASVMVIRLAVRGLRSLWARWFKRRVPQDRELSWAGAVEGERAGTDISRRL